MKIRKLILPMLAIIFAISMAFANVNLKTEPELQSKDYVLLSGSWKAIPEQSCTNGQFDCEIRYGENGPVLKVYDEMGDTAPKHSPSKTPTIINP